MTSSGGAAADISTTSDGFSDRVVVFFMTQALTAGLALFNGFFLARLLGPVGKGDYYLLTFLPPTLMVLSQLGLPQAFAFFSARDLTQGLVMRTVGLAVLISIPILVLTLALLPGLQATTFHGLESMTIVVPLLALPFILNATFTTGIVVGRQAAVALAVVNVVVYVSATILLLVLVGVLALGVWGALIAFLLNGMVLAAGFLVCAARVTRAVPKAGSVSYGRLLRYGVPFYPGSLTQFFAFRADVYLLAWLLAEPAAPLGYYSVAVTMAELAFLFPQAVATFFFPHVAGASRADSDRQVAMVSRVTLLLTAAVAVVLLPSATLAMRVLLPDFEPALPALYVLMPGVIAAAVSQVLSGYVAGLGRPSLVSFVSLLGFGSNVGLNLLLIPRFGIVGASASSLFSYSLASVVYSVIAAHLAGHRVSDFWVPRVADLEFVVSTALALVHRIVRRVAPHH